MFTSTFYKKKFKKILLSINKILESFFAELNRSKFQSNKQQSIKKKIIHLDNTIEGFFDKFKNFGKFNQSKKKPYYLDKKIGVFITTSVFLFFSYFFIPAFYNKSEIQQSLVNQILNKYDINIKFNEKIKYGLFPKPFFYTKNLDIIFDDEVLGKSGYTKFHISYNNFFSPRKLEVKDLVFQNTEFNTDINNINFFNKILKNLNTQNKVVFKKNKLFFKDMDQDLLFLSKLKKIDYYFDNKNQLQKLNSELEIFNVPLNLKVSRNYNDKKKLIKLNSRKIRLNTETSIEHNEKEINGFFEIIFFNKKNLFNYKIENEKLYFLSKDKNFNGLLNFKPFYFSSDLNFDYVSQKKIFNNESLILEILNTDLLYNQNLNAVFNFNINKIEKFEYFKDLKLRIVFGDRRILANDFDVKWNESVSLRSQDIEFINERNEKKLIGEIKFNFNDVEKFFRYFQIKRNYRSLFNQIKADFVYDFNEGKITINNIVVDDKSNEKVNLFIEEYNKKEKNLFNKVTFRNFVKDFFKIYSG